MAMFLHSRGRLAVLRSPSQGKALDQVGGLSSSSGRTAGRSLRDWLVFSLQVGIRWVSLGGGSVLERRARRRRGVLPAPPNSPRGLSAGTGVALRGVLPGRPAGSENHFGRDVGVESSLVCSAVNFLY